MKNSFVAALLLLAGCATVPSLADRGVPRVRLESTPGGGIESWRSHWRLCPATSCDGPLPPTYPITLHVALRNTVCDLAWLDAELDAVSDPFSPRYGAHYTAAALESACAPGRTAALEAVRSWVASDAGEGSQVVPMLSSDWVEVRTTARGAASLLGGASFRKFSPVSEAAASVTPATGYIVRAPEGYTVPLGMDAHVLAVAGVFRFPRPLPPRGPAEFSSNATDITPAIIHERYGIYGVPTPPDANKQAVVSFLEQYYSPDDLSKFLKEFGLGGDVAGIANQIGPNDPTKPGGEATLDVDYLCGVATGVETWVWSTAGRNPGNNQEPFVVWLTDVQQALGNGQMPVLVFSISYQDFEDTVTAAYATAVSMDFARLGLMGITLATGSGDWSTGDVCSQGTPQQCLRFRADFPSSSPYIVSTGSTQLQDGAESAASYSSGGFSDIFPRMRSQESAVSAYLAAHGSEYPQHLFNASGRAFPDISTVGVNFQVLIGGKVVSESGTSASTPTGAAIVSLLNSARLASGLPPMGNVLPFYYAFPDAFVDITSGQGSLEGCCKKSFSAVKGWDPITGLGVPDFQKLLAHAMSVGARAAGKNE